MGLFDGILGGVVGGPDRNGVARPIGVAVMLAVALSAHAATSATTASAPAEAARASSVAAETGLAAVYSDRLNGRRTASGSRYDRNKLTAAHKTLAFGTEVKVTNTRNGKSVVLKITDRGPKQANRILDVSPRAAKALGIGRHAMAVVNLEPAA
jgi:rare lipoprotein A